MNMEPHLDFGGIKVYQGDCIDVLDKLPPESVNTCITSPPYYGLRDYGTASWAGGDKSCDHELPDEAGQTTKPTEGQETYLLRFTGCTCWKCGAMRNDKQIGLEPNLGAYIYNLVKVFSKIRKVLRDDGSLWLNIGDAYSSNKALLGVPWKVAFALQDDGWLLRSSCVWSKPNPMPESCRDRPTKSHEMVFLFTKQPNYYYDFLGNAEKGEYGPKNCRDVWFIPTESCKEAHFATFPRKLVETCLLSVAPAMGRCSHCGRPLQRIIKSERIATRPGKNNKTDPTEMSNRDSGRHVTKITSIGWKFGCGCNTTKAEPCIVLDPFIGSGTVAGVAKHFKSKCVGIELNKEYIKLIPRRVKYITNKYKGIKQQDPVKSTRNGFLCFDHLKRLYSTMRD